MDSAKKLATYKDLLSVPEQTRAEVIHGQVIVSPSQTPAHQSIVGEIYAELRGPFQRGRGGPGGWWLIPDLDVEFGPHDILRPDVGGWRKERVASFPAERPVRHRPDWICEGLSPGSAARDQGDKRAVYQNAAVPWFWLVDPAHRALTVLRLGAEGYIVETVAGDAGVVRLPPFEAIEIDLGMLYPPGD